MEGKRDKNKSYKTLFLMFQASLPTLSSQLSFTVVAPLLIDSWYHSSQAEYLEKLALVSGTCSAGGENI